MEEDAVNFLGSLSGVRDIDSSYEDLETSRDESLVSDSKSPKKGRKSIPRKRVNRQLEDDGTKLYENGHAIENFSDDELESEQVNELTYSEEERENEERMRSETVRSEYFDISENNKKSRRKRKRDVSYRVEDVLEDYTNTEYDNTEFDNTETLEEETDEGIDEIDKDDMGDETEDYEENEDVTAGKRSTRKRKRKYLEDGFVGENFGDDEMEGWSPQPKARKKKGAKLDSLIASKFNV